MEEGDYQGWGEVRAMIRRKTVTMREGVEKRVIIGGGRIIGHMM